MLKFGKEAYTQGQTPEKLNKERIIEKAIARYLRKLEGMVDGKAPAEHILKSAATYGLESSDFNDKVNSYLKKCAEESAPKAEATIEVSTESMSKPEVKTSKPKKRQSQKLIQLLNLQSPRLKKFKGSYIDKP